MVKQKITLTWMQHSAFSASLITKGIPEILSDNEICFSNDGHLARDTDKANLLQKKIGEILQTLYSGQSPLVRKITFNKAGITIYRTEFKTWEIRCARIETELTAILKQEGVEAEFIYKMEEFKD